MVYSTLHHLLYYKDILLTVSVNNCMYCMHADITPVCVHAVFDIVKKKIKKMVVATAEVAYS